MFIGLPSRLWLYCVVGLTCSCSDGHGWGALVDSKQMRQTLDAVRESPLVREPTDEREAALSRLSAADRGQLMLALDAVDLSWDRRDHPADPDAERALEGALNFFLPFPDGNGRACATCHLPSDGFSISPATVEARWQRLEHARKFEPAADDPLFRALDADDGQQDFTLLRTRALIKVRVPLPSRVRLSDSPNASEVTVSRAVPALNMLEHTAPYQQDRSAATLEEQARGAVFAHMEPSAEPSLDFLETIAEFERRLFSSPGVKKLSRAIDREQPLPEIDPELNSLEQRGKEKFNEFCSKCHGGPAQVKNLESRIFPPFDGSTNPRSLNVGISNPLPDGFPASPIHVPERQLLAQRFSVDLPDGTTVELLSSDPGTVLTDEQALETVIGKQVFNRFDIPQLRGINRTAPYFHDHRANTLEEVVKHYQAFFFFINVVRGLPLPKIPDEDIAPIVAYMKRAL